jgi:aerobic carbon-monoxide dehydrogenase medium subunit
VVGGAMKPAPFEYVAPRTAGEAVAALADGAAQVLAGGQSLVLEMNVRNRRPARVVDINRVPEFAGLDVADGTLRVRPLARHRAFEGALGAGPLGRLLGRVVHHIAHPPIRSRGTMLGSLAYAHPAAEWPAVATALGAVLDLTGPTGTRTVAAAEFFTGPFSTVRRPEELLSEARLPLLAPGTGVGFAEHRRTRAGFAQLAAVATVKLRAGRIDAVRVGLVNAADRPVRAHAAERVLLGQPPADVVLAEAGRAAGEQDADPRPQPYTDIAYQRHAVCVLVRRALAEAHHDLIHRGR